MSNIEIDISTLIVPLSPDLFGKASKELHEKVEWRKRDVEALRQMIKEENSLNCCMDDFFLLRFLRAKKFDYENAFKMVKNYYFVKHLYPEIFQNLNPQSVKNVFDDGILNILNGVDYYGRKIVLFKPANINCDNCTMDDIVRALLMSLELMLCNENIQVHGICILIDASNVSLSQIFQNFKPTLIRKAFHCLQGSFPCRLKGIHFIHESHLLDAIMLLVKPFLSEKTRNKMFFHGHDFTSLQQHIDSDALPSDISGCAEACTSTLSVHWFECLTKVENYFQYMASFGYQTTPSPSNHEISQHSEQQGSLKTAFNAYKRLCIDGLNN